jgi:MoaA/NifB/PqqE/SkfB family radical SAM enzyme
MSLYSPIQSVKLLGKWSANRMIGKRRPLVAVLGLTHYCNYYCPMCPYGVSDKDGQILLEKKYGLSTDQWKIILGKVSKYCIWCIFEGGEPTSRPDFMEILKYANSLKMPVTLISNCSLLHTIDLDELKKHILFMTCSIDSVFEESYCKVRGVPPHIYERVMKNLRLLVEHDVPHNFNSVITKWNTEEFITKSYFDKAKELGVDSVSLTFAEDRFDVNYSCLPDKDAMERVCTSVLEYIKSKKLPHVMIPPLYFEQIIKYGRTMFDECGVWKSLFVNPNGTVMVPCWKFNAKENTYSLLEMEVDEIWNAPQWEIAKTCHDCKVLCCVWTSSQPVTTIGNHYIRTMLGNLKI